MIRLVTDTFWLAVRSLREAARQPGIEFGNLFIPIFFFAVTVGAIGIGLSQDSITQYSVR